MKKGTLILGALVGLVGLLVVAGVGYWLASPLFRDDVVDEALPAEAIEPLEEEAMPEEDMAEEEMVEEEAMPEEDMAEETSAEEEVMEEEPMEEDMAEEAPAETMMLEGLFMDADSFHQGSGAARIVQLEDGSMILRFEDFEVTNGPDLHVFLSAHPAPATSDDLHTNEAFVYDLGALKGNIGNQNYEIPAGTDLSGVQSVVIYCVPFKVVFATATIA